jgi:hypothetical protein
MQAQDLANAVAALLDEDESVTLMTMVVLHANGHKLTVSLDEALAVGPAELVSRWRRTRP